MRRREQEVCRVPPPDTRVLQSRSFLVSRMNNKQRSPLKKNEHKRKDRCRCHDNRRVGETPIPLSKVSRFLKCDKDHSHCVCRNVASMSNRLAVRPLLTIVLTLLLLLATTTVESKAAGVVAVPDDVTTYTGRSILSDVLKNDYHTDNVSTLSLTGISTTSQHGTCSIVTDPFFGSTNILYEPTTDASYSGTDSCSYKVCAVENDSDCDTSTLTITIAKELQPVLDISTDDDAVFDSVAAIDNEEDDGTTSTTTLLTTRPNSHNMGNNLVDWAVDPINTLVQDAMANAIDTTFDPALADGIWTTTTNPIINFDTTTICDKDNNEVLLTLELQTDKHGEDVSWEFREVITPTLFKRFKKSEAPYTIYSYDKVDVCVQNGKKYIFLIKDVYGDGLCQPDTGRKCGYYKLYLNGKVIVHGFYYGTKNTHLINVGYDPSSSLSSRDVQFLRAHNTRRRTWHESYNVSYVPLRWSPMLAEESRVWAEVLLDECDLPDIQHEPNVYMGENLAKNKGEEYDKDGVPSWGQLYNPENIVRRWADREIGWAYPDNAHLTQALWRASRYLGCGEAVKEWNGGKCRIQVCRYAKAGNCDMSRFDATNGENWLTPMLSASSPCEPSCPPEGCF